MTEERSTLNRVTMTDPCPDCGGTVEYPADVARADVTEPWSHEDCYDRRVNP